MVHRRRRGVVRGRGRSMVPRSRRRGVLSKAWARSDEHHRARYGCKKRPIHDFTSSSVPLTVTYVPCAVFNNTRTVRGASISDESGSRPGEFMRFR